MHTADFLYSVIVVCLNAGEELKKTVGSALAQTYGNYEIVIKDGGSTDGSLEQLPKDDRIHIFTKQDQGIYDAMNQAIANAHGDYYIFMNAGDYFYDSNILHYITEFVMKQDHTPDIVYGNLYNRKLNTKIQPAPVIDAFTCYRNVPCHQSCIYHKNMFMERGYKQEYTVRADYEHFLWCYFERKADIRFADICIANYEGNGFSETKDNLKKSEQQHREIVEKYMGKKQADKYRAIMMLTLAPIRSKMADNKALSGIYNKVKKVIYRR